MVIKIACVDNRLKFNNLALNIMKELRRFKIKSFMTDKKDHEVKCFINVWNTEKGGGHR